MSRDNESTYYDAGGIETLDVIRAKLTPEQYSGYLLGNAIKYHCRMMHKSPGNILRDAKKAANYSAWLRDEIEHQEREVVFGRVADVDSDTDDDQDDHPAAPPADPQSMSDQDADLTQTIREHIRRSEPYGPIKSTKPATKHNNLSVDHDGVGWVKPVAW